MGGCCSRATGQRPGQVLSRHRVLCSKRWVGLWTVSSVRPSNNGADLKPIHTQTCTRLRRQQHTLVLDRNCMTLSTSARPPAGPTHRVDSDGWPSPWQAKRVEVATFSWTLTSGWPERSSDFKLQANVHVGTDVAKSVCCTLPRPCACTYKLHESLRVMPYVDKNQDGL